jgi:SPP1 gp7 family putative phage head morphogenesis protein
MKIKNETEIQLMKILFKTNGSKATKNITSKRAYPFGIEKQYYTKLKSFFKPLTDYVNKYVDENLEQLLRGDSTEIKLDAIPGDSFRDMIYNLENWLSIYMPDISELPSDSNNNVILVSLAKTAEEAKEFGDKEFQKTIEKGIHVNPPVSSSWWGSMRDSWAEDNYTLITSNAKKYVSQINTLTEQAIVNGLSPAKLKAEIKKATEGLSDKHCKLLARDQMGKLNGQITQAQMQELGLDMYVWSTAYDDRVRDSHALMEGLLCRWDDASVCSYDNGKTWVERPSGAVDLHPGQDIQCRCVALSFYPELEAEITGTSLSEQTEGLPEVQDLPQFNEISNAYFSSNYEENKNWLQSQFEEKRLTGEEFITIQDYTDKSFEPMNNRLRYGRYKLNSDNEIDKKIDILSKALNKEIGKDIVVYRGAESDFIDTLLGEIVSDVKTSEKNSVIQKLLDEKSIIFNEKGFMSTSIHPEGAHGKVMMKINVPKKAKGLYVEPITKKKVSSWEHAEDELLLQKNYSLKIKTVKYNTETWVYEVEADLIIK